ncbi:FAD-dependent oxidoreductase [Granulicoccus sp. GXG6511]|uniref:FAD-dependent oxidoreductase n=1 Tax=Granulicoccus sp. GXG6511 TaxID=3381351 RepID=UPI003D7E9E18
MRVVVIGGVAGGMSAAARLRRLEEHAEIVVVERSGNVSFANCGLPYHVGGVIEERSALLLQTPQSLAARFGIDVRVRTEATRIDRERKIVCVRSLDDGSETELAYDKVILSPGARPVRPPIPGIERALSLRDVEDTDAMVAAVGEAKTAVVIGGGFIGLEVAENLLHRGLQVAVVEATDQVMAPLDPEMVQPVHQVLRDAGIDLRLGAAVTEVGATDVALADGTRLPADLVVAAIGVRPDSALAESAGLAVGERGGIVVDEFHRTDDSDIYAVGDAVEKIDRLTGKPAMIPLANTANLQGRRVADHIAGLSGAGRPTQGTAIVGILGLQVASTGWNEKKLRETGRAHLAIHTHPASHATYYPGAETMALKLLVDPETDEILGAQGVGRDGVDRRIDVIATAMQGGLKASELAELELAYAPQFSSAKDPVNMLGFIAENHRTGMTSSIQWHELDEAMADGAALIDVRTPGEFAAGAIPGAINIPVDDLRERLDELPEGELLVHCAVGIRGHIATRLLAAHGREARNLSGGYRTWVSGTA